MKKYILLITVAIVFAFYAKAQQPAPSDDIKTASQLRHNMHADKDDSWGPISFKQGLHTFVKLDVDTDDKKSKIKASVGYYGNSILAQLNAIKEFELAVTDITPKNADKYLYHVIVNDSIEVVHWTKPNIFRSNKFTSYAYLGKFNCLNKIIKVEVYEVNNYNNKATLIFNGGHMPAPKINYVALKLNNKYLFDPNKLEYIPNSKQRYFQVNGPAKHPISFTWSDSINHLSVQMANTLQNYMYQVFLKREFEGKLIFWPIGNSWEQTFYSPNPEMHINASYFKNPGKYTIIITPKMPDGFKLKDSAAIATVSFTVLPGPISFPLKTVLFIILIILTTGGFMFFMYRDQQKRKLAKEAMNKQVARLQLQSVRAQLNPHFIFNALAGIQNLMNKNEVENANKYLSRFARLTRNVLDDGQKELTSIEHETDLLKDYLQMEQMRFGFKFSIDVNTEEIDQQVEIPAMLLQPFVENAVKHGVSALKNEGEIKVSINKKDDSLILSVQDNGNGFGFNQADGIGMKLCNERIKLLNSIYKNTAILLHKTSGNSGTTITIELQNWV
jgi:two-component system LytT family sensor kinase